MAGAPHDCRDTTPSGRRRVNELGAQVDVEGRPRATGPALIEVYPGASARVLGHGRPVLSDEASYKRDPSVRRSLVRHVASTLNVELGGFEDKLVRDAKRSDETDAFLAALYAAHCLQLFALPAWQVRCPESGAEREAARAEGWMFFRCRGCEAVDSQRRLRLSCRLLRRAGARAGRGFSVTARRDGSPVSAAE